MNLNIKFAENKNVSDKLVYPNKFKQDIIHLTDILNLIGLAEIKQFLKITCLLISVDGFWKD